MAVITAIPLFILLALLFWIMGPRKVKRMGFSILPAHFTEDLKGVPKDAGKSFLRAWPTKEPTQDLHADPVDNPILTIESFNRQFQIGEKERETVKWGWEQEMRKTMFHVVSAYTRMEQFEGLSAEPSYRLQKVGGMVLGMIK